MRIIRVTAGAFGLSMLFVGIPSIATSVSASTVAQVASRCVAAVPGHPGPVDGILPPRPILATSTSTCAASAFGELGTTSPADSYDGNPPLQFFGGPVMGTSSAVVVTPIYWSPSGFPSTYQSLTGQFITDVAHDDGLATNVFSNLDQYTDTNGNANTFGLTAATPINDNDAFPSGGGCTPDTGPVYSDNSVYTACVTDLQIQTELSTVLTNDGLPRDLSHLYLVYLPKGVESCFDTSNTANRGHCTISQATTLTSGSFCGYHSSFGQTLYADLPYPVVDSPVSNFTCGSDAGQLLGGGVVGAQSPNNNFDADTEISVASHELSEAITDPQGTAWFDTSFEEVADECAYIYGDSTTFGGSFGSEYNQTINGHHYFIQEEFSNHNYFLNPADSCSQGLAWTTRTVAFNANGGSGTLAPESDNAPTTLTANAFVRTGYTFTGWNTASDGSGANFANGATYAFTSDMTLFAQWQPILNWPAPSEVGYGTALSGAQLDATASIPGSFSYSPSAGSVLGVGTTTLAVTFIPADSTDFSPFSRTVSFTVNPAPLQITASSTTMSFGTTPPRTVASFSGFVNGESATSLSAQPVCVTSATKSTRSGVDTGANSCSGASDLNYAIVYAPGNVTITPPLLRNHAKTLAIMAGTRTAAKVTCSGGVCKGTLSIVQRQVTRVKKGKKTVTVTKSILLGHVSFSIKPGKSATEVIALNLAGRHFLSKASSAHPLSVALKVVLTQGRTTLTTVKVI